MFSNNRKFNRFVEKHILFYNLIYQNPKSKYNQYYETSIYATKDSPSRLWQYRK